MPRSFWWAVIGCCVAFAATAAEIEGDARPSDARTLVIRGTHIALLDIRPFDPNALCGESGATWPCGDVSLHALAALVAGRRISCELVNKVGHGDFQGRCASPDGADLATTLVSGGWARAADPTLAPQQDAAKAARRGAWGAPPH